MTRALRLLAFFVASFAMWAVLGLLPVNVQAVAGPVIGVIIGAIVQQQSAKKLAAEVAERHKADIQEIGRAAMALARDLDAANLEIQRLRAAQVTG